jgi:hypothetical protein
MFEHDAIRRSVLRGLAAVPAVALLLGSKVAEAKIGHTIFFQGADERQDILLFGAARQSADGCVGLVVETPYPSKPDRPWDLTLAQWYKTQSSVIDCPVDNDLATLNGKVTEATDKTLLGVHMKLQGKEGGRELVYTLGRARPIFLPGTVRIYRL